MEARDNRAVWATTRELWLVLSLCCIALPAEAVAQSRDSLYVFGDLLADTATSRWCAYSNPVAWKAAAESAHALTSGVVEFKRGRVAVIKLVEDGESGDWLVYSTYMVDSAGAIRRLNRMINDLPTQSSLDQRFVIRNGRAILLSAKNHDLHTRKPTGPPSDWVPDLPIATTLQAFGFFPLIERDLNEVRSRGELCTAPLPRVLVSVLPLVRARSRIPVLLPSELPPPIREAKHAVADSDRVSADNYAIMLFYQLGMGHAGFAGAFGGESTRKFDPGELPNVYKVRLAHDYVGYFSPVSCGGSCAPANIWWEEAGVTYDVQISLPSTTSEKDQEDLMTGVANSAIVAGPR